MIYWSCQDLHQLGVTNADAISRCDNHAGLHQIDIHTTGSSFVKQPYMFRLPLGDNRLPLFQISPDISELHVWATHTNFAGEYMYGAWKDMRSVGLWYVIIPDNSQSISIQNWPYIISILQPAKIIGMMANSDKFVWQDHIRYRQLTIGLGIEFMLVMCSPYYPVHGSRPQNSRSDRAS